MKIYDTHSDIFDNLYHRVLEGVKDPFKEFHLTDLTKGEVVGGIWVIYSASDFDVVKAYELAQAVFKKYENGYDVIFGLEGLRNVPDIATFDKLYQMGIRHAMLTWNEENHLATGVKGDPKRGITELGRQFLKYMNDHKMIIDVSHLNEKSFFEVLVEKPKILIASHSNAKALSDHMRNLTDEQLSALYEAGGYIGCVAARNFVSFLKEKQNVKGLVDQIDYLVEKMTIDRVMLGLDMMNYLDDFNNSNLDDLSSHAACQLIVEELVKRGYKQKDIEKICFGNYLKIKERVKGVNHE